MIFTTAARRVCKKSRFWCFDFGCLVFTGTCYAKVRDETEEIKSAMGVDTLKYNQPRTEVAVVYENEAEHKDYHVDKHVVEEKKKRPEWFHHKLMTKVGGGLQE